MSQLTIKEEILREFDKILSEREDKMYGFYKSTFLDDFEGGYNQEYDKPIKDFISSALDKQLDKVIKIAEWMKKPTLTKPVREGVIGTMSINCEYNQALSDLIAKLRDK